MLELRPKREKNVYQGNNVALTITRRGIFLRRKISGYMVRAICGKCLGFGRDSKIITLKSDVLTGNVTEKIEI